MCVWKYSLGLAAVLAVGLGLSACDKKSSTPQERYVLISHAPDSDAWWNTVKNAIQQAGEDFGVQVDYRNPPNGDLTEMARLIEQATARNYDGVAFDIADFDVLAKPAANVTARGIPLVTLNSGTIDESKKLGAIMHIGQPEYEAGRLAGERARAIGIHSFVCVNHDASNIASIQRCQGFADAIGADLRTSMIDTGADPTRVASKLGAYLRHKPSTQALLALGPSSAEPAIQVVEQMSLAGKIYFGTFDLSPAIITALKKGTLNFAIDQQPYLQGYMSIAATVIAHEEKTTDPNVIIAKLKAHPKFQERLQKYGLEVVYTTSGVNSGPAFVTRDNMATIEKYAGQYR